MANTDLCKHAYYKQGKSLTQEFCKLAYMKSIGERIRTRRKELALGSQARLAVMVGVKRESITQWENDSHKPEGGNLLKLAVALQCSPNWILSGAESAQENDSVSVAPDIQGLIPIISEVQAGAWMEIKEHFTEVDAVEWIPSFRQSSRYAFALRVVGDSMLSLGNPKSLTEGQIVLVEPEIEPQHRDIVVARLANSNKATVKQLLIDGDDRILSPINQNYRPIPVTQDVVIVGVVVDAVTRFR